MLDDILELLDTPRQAITNFGRGVFGENDLLGGLPGALGVLGTLGLGATGVGLPLALLGGSFLGGGLQAGGNASGNAAFKAPTAEEVSMGMFGSDDFLPSLLAGALTDPLSYVGGIGGARAGAKIGRGVEDAVKVAGPAYDGRNALMEAIAEADKKFASYGADGVFQHKYVDNLSPEQFGRIAGEVPEGSTFLGSGVDAVAMRTPTGDVVRVGKTFPGAPGRPEVDFINPATRTVDLPGTKSGSLRVERSPLAEVRGEDYWYGPAGTDQRYALQDAGHDIGIRLHDSHPGNFGLLGDRPVIIDSGAYSVNADKFPGKFAPVQTVTDPSQDLGPLARLLRGRGRLRGTLERTRDDLGIERLLSKIGAGLGTGSVMAERSL